MYMQTLMVYPLMIGTSELLLIVLLALLLFGGKKLPEMMRGLGQGVKSFKQGMNEVQKAADPDEKQLDEEVKETQTASSADVEKEKLHGE